MRWSDEQLQDEAIDDPSADDSPLLLLLLLSSPLLFGSGDAADESDDSRLRQELLPLLLELLELRDFFPAIVRSRMTVVEVDVFMVALVSWVGVFATAAVAAFTPCASSHSLAIVVFFHGQKSILGVTATGTTAGAVAVMVVLVLAADGGLLPAFNGADSRIFTSALPQLRYPPPFLVHQTVG
uniref:Uncharacterized protein n=1 Tax=Anopheles atroparvus TaxID=41427 RepID=A0A182ILL6_ANOAO